MSTFGRDKRATFLASGLRTGTIISWTEFPWWLSDGPGIPGRFERCDRDRTTEMTATIERTDTAGSTGPWYFSILRILASASRNGAVCRARYAQYGGGSAGSSGGALSKRNRERSSGRHFLEPSRDRWHLRARYAVVLPCRSVLVRKPAASRKPKTKAVTPKPAGSHQSSDGTGFTRCPRPVHARSSHEVADNGDWLPAPRQARSPLLADQGRVSVPFVRALPSSRSRAKVALSAFTAAWPARGVVSTWPRVRRQRPSRHAKRGQTPGPDL